MTDVDIHHKAYGKLMDELFVRLDFIGRANRTSLPMPAKVIEEACFLQLRMCCEMIGLAILVAHKGGDTTKLHKEYKPGVIMKNLEGLNPSYFPIACKYEMAEEEGGPGTKKMVMREQTLFPKDLAEMHATAGSKLHFLSLKAIKSGKEPFDPDYQLYLESCIQNIWNHMHLHTILLPDTKMIGCRISPPDEEGKNTTVFWGS